MIPAMVTITLCQCQLRASNFRVLSLNPKLLVPSQCRDGLGRAHVFERRGWDLGLRVQGLGFRVQGLGFRVQGLGFRV